MTEVEALVEEARALLNNPQLPTWEEEQLRMTRAGALIGLAQLAELDRLNRAVLALAAQLAPAAPASAGTG